MQLTKKILNASSERVIAKCGGVNFVFEPYQEKSLSLETANWILERWEKLGLVDVSYSADISDYQLYVVKKIIEGKQAYREHKKSCVEQFISLDTEYKNQNQFGTVLNCKELRLIMKQIEDTTKQISDLQTKFGIDYEKEEFLKTQNDMFATIDTIVNSVEADSDQVRKMSEFNAYQDSVFKEVMGSVVSSSISA